mgnify:CR=1 FL=1
MAARVSRFYAIHLHYRFLMHVYTGDISQHMHSTMCHLGAYRGRVTVGMMTKASEGSEVTLRMSSTSPPALDVCPVFRLV